MAFTNIEADQNFDNTRRSLQFYAVFPGLCFSILLVALDTSIVGTALPTIVSSLGSGALYIWIVNGYFLSVAVVQPLAGQMADIFGRRAPMLTFLALFTLGSGLCAGASSTEMLIAARIIQGIGGGGISVLVSIIVGDMVPLRYRQKYMAIVMSFFALGTFIGPIVGGAIVTRVSWRWTFYINLPVGGVAILLVFFFLKVKHPTNGATLPRVLKLDWLGHALLSASVVSVLISLTWGGTKYPWNSGKVLAPLILGGFGLIIYLLHQQYVSKDPSMPLRLYGNRTSLLGFVLTFLHGLIMSWFSFFIPVYFQVLKEDSPLRAGINVLAVAIPFTPAGIIGGLIVTWSGRYKPVLLVGLALLPIATGCFTLLTAETPTAQWAVFQVIAGLGGGLALTSTLPVIQAPLTEDDLAAATATWAFVRSFGMIWGGSIPAAVFNSKVDSLVSRIDNAEIRNLLALGGAYEHATRLFIISFNSQPVLKAQIISVYTEALRQTWYVLLAFACITGPIALFLREIPLRTKLETQYGLDEPQAMAESTNMDASFVNSAVAVELETQDGPAQNRKDITRT
ncbi:major facilitator superfamily domain-containing protein [Trichoderma barbatum]